MKNTPKVYDNFISSNDSDILIKFIDKNISKFSTGIKNLIYFLRYGKDIHFKEDDYSVLTTDIKKIINMYSEKITTLAKQEFNVSECYLTQIWIVKRIPENVHMPHDDYEYGDEHLQFGGVVYLNDTGLDGGGEIYFTKLNFEYKPKGNDMILFNSRDINNTHGVRQVNKDRYSLAFWTTANKEFALNF